MSLNYGFNYFGYAKNKDKESWNKKFKDLPEDRKEFYHNYLPWLLLSVDISHVSEETIPLIVERDKINYAFYGGSSLNSDDMNEDILKEFIGFETNVGTKTDKEFIKKLLESHRRSKLFMNKSGVDKEFERYKKKIHKV